MTYDQAYQELTTILEEIQSENVSIDSLAEKIKRANELKVFCQNKLRDIEASISSTAEE